MRLTAACFAFVVLVATACDDSQPVSIPTGGLFLLAGQDCDSVVPEHCGFPMPSNVYLVDDTVSDPQRPTKKHIAFGATTLPEFAEGMHIDPSRFADHDGFSPGEPPMTFLASATAVGLPTQDNMEMSTTAASPTILLDADSGELVPHFAEVDESTFDDTTRTLMLRPAVRLKDSTRYIVAVRHVVDTSGKVIAPSPAFQALRDGLSSPDFSVDRRRALYADIFSKLAAAGIDKSDLQIAWDYSTASQINNTQQMIAMRDDALATVGADGPDYTIESVTENPDPMVRRRIMGLMTVPLYLSDPNPGGHLMLDANGLPTKNGTAQFEFEVNIPVSVANAASGAALLQNGHGLLGQLTEGQDSYLVQFANDYGYVAFSIDLLGMAHDEVDYILNTALPTDIGLFRSCVDRQHQGLLNELLLMRLMKGKFSRDPNVQFNGHSAIDTTKAFYRGDSQGGIFGVTYMALSTDVTRGMLGEPGAPYSLILNRSADFSGFSALLHIIYKDPRDVQIAISLLQILWDRTEPDGYMPYVTSSMFPNTPAHNVVIEAAIGDHQVAPIGAHVIARAVGAKNIMPVNRELFGIPDMQPPFQGSGIVEYDYGLPPSPETNLAPTGPDDSDPHDKLRSVPSSQLQVDFFFRTGIIYQFCGGLCKGM
jgi:hypothetical protein